MRLYFLSSIQTNKLPQKYVCKKRTAHLKVSFVNVSICFLNTVWVYSIKSKIKIHSNHYTTEMLPYKLSCFDDLQL